ncbi:MAG: hypothetical protein HYW25_01950 [Candidatus Aenigmarchaeota archaeon]|nr:hypothetical protein [Candidatus Aenigmarchaeota archaeon]
MAASELVYVGLFVVVIGIILIIVGGLVNAQESRSEVAVGGFIGTIPFGFATNPAMFLIVLIITVIVAAAFFAVSFRII